MTPSAESSPIPETEINGGIEAANTLAFDASHFLPDLEAARLLPRRIAARYQVAPLSLDEKTIRVGMCNTMDLEALDYIEMVTRRTVVPVEVTSDQFRELIQRIYGSSTAGPEELSSTVAEVISLAKDSTDGSELPIIRLVDQILAEAVRSSATDIHIQPEEDETVIRARVDGMLRILTLLPRKVHTSLTTRVKVMADLDISERRMPQDGEIQLVLGDRKIDLRVSTVPTIFGENIVLRILDHSRVMLGLEDLGYRPDDKAELEGLLQRPNGIILVTGPTGSGKSTTLYAAMRSIDSASLNIMTLEDPVEYQLKGIRQSQISEKAGFTFASGLRAFMRQDPDVILVGEMRDQETAEIALRAALTGHLVLSTLHTTSAVGSIARLRDMGMKDFLLAGTLAGILAQRLVRKICKECGEEFEAGMPEKKFLGIPEDRQVTLRRAKGCKSCRDSGYRGRFAVYELLKITPNLAHALAHGIPQTELETMALKEGLIPLRQMGVTRVLEGWTTIEELARAVV
ncbi:MAG: GspE/PulE family protein [Candidatus Eisenbacteria bacterium]|uniref:GspE/PulE family protein n=1 Tax=Eiseniibacteriota bacterium TaxID=2212470 RepID=A0A948W5X1_UNCEI|nr:GspE/PulE family protein [Candidatus Eisenbacteria bacterium]MBU2690011.1 GspE/PulE family protein [Candidatus Eisenbacteria bacterium]